MVNTMGTTGDMHESNNHPQSYLADVIERFRECEKRTFPRVYAETFPEPDEEKDVPMSIEEYRGACKESGIEVLLSEDDKSHILEKVKTADHKKLAKMYQSGRRMCLTFMPVVTSNEPTIRLFQLLIMGKGLTYGYTGDPAYYYRSLPEEIQEACTFTVPIYKDVNFPTGKERQALMKKIGEAFDNLKKLLEV